MKDAKENPVQWADWDR